MFSIPAMVNRRRKRRERWQRNAYSHARKFSVAGVTIVGMVLSVVVAWLAAQYSVLTQDLPSLDQLPVLLDPQSGLLLQPTRLYDRTGSHVILTIENTTSTPHRYLPFTDPTGGPVLPQYFLDAIVASIDPTFWQQPGFTFESLSPAAAPTLAQRLVGDLLLWSEPPAATSRLRESILAAQAVDRFGWSQVLEWYLNSADFGNLAYGADAAAHVYFGKSAADLTLAEAAMLAAVARAPDINPIDAPQLAIQHQGEVLEAMVTEGFITTGQALGANALPLAINAPTASPLAGGSAFTDWVLSSLSTYIGRGRVLRGGLRIITTLDLDLQTQATCTITVQLSRLSEATLSTDDCMAARLLPALRREESNPVDGLGSGVVVIDPATGQVLALAGDALTKRPPGSMLTPFVYLTAFTRGFSPASLVWDIPANLSPALEGYTNSDGSFHGPIGIRTAMANDYLIPAFQIANQVGIENVWTTARQSGLNGLPPLYSEDPQRMLLDGAALSLLELTHAYGMFANQGFLAGQPGAGGGLAGAESIAPTAVLSVIDYQGRTLLDWSQPQIRAVVSPQLAYLITHVLADEDARRPSLGRPNAFEVGFPAAGKPGQTFDQSQTWAVGYTPHLAVGAWVGFPNSALTQPLSPAIPSGIWNALMRYSHQAIDYTAWDVPFGISQVEVCIPSGLLPTVYCPTTTVEVFLNGSEPILYDNLYRQVEINRQSGRLATVFTPPEQIESQVFLSVPPEALDWARESGFPLPPETYDVVFLPSAPDPDATISAPLMFSYVGGVVEVHGSAAGSDFDFYRLQVGRGLNPDQWVQIGEEERQPVEDGLLGRWQTGEESGLYALQLLVVYDDQTVKTATIQVTVDNQPPEVNILFPADEQIFSYPSDLDLVFQVQAGDNLALDRLEVYLDGELLTTLTKAPFAVPWLGTPGAHTLRLVAFDLAGNAAEHEITFLLQR